MHVIDTDEEQMEILARVRRIYLLPGEHREIVQVEGLKIQVLRRLSGHASSSCTHKEGQYNTRGFSPHQERRDEAGAYFANAAVSRACSPRASSRSGFLSEQ